MAEFHFIRPFFLLALLPLALVVWRVFRHRLTSGNWAAVCDAELLPHILLGDSGKRHQYATLLIGISGVIAIIALAGPTWERLPQPVFRSDSALVIALDLSRSMDASDIHPSRLERARYKITDLLQLRGDGQTALIVYAGDAFTVSPLTDDVQTIIAQLSALTTVIMPVQGGNSAAALTHAVSLLKRAGNRTGHVLLITDGIDGENANKQITAAFQQGYRVSILAVGTAEGAPVTLANGGFLQDERGAIVIPATDHARLSTAAALGGGRYRPLQTGDVDIGALNAFFNDRAPASGAIQSAWTTDVWREQGPWLALLLLPFAAFAFRRGYILLLLIAILPLPRHAAAFEWRDLWLNADQKALRQFNAGEVEQAADTFRDPAWKAAAKYRIGDYQAVPELLQADQSEHGFYNSGNALARQGKYQEALQAYEETLALNPAHENAKYNQALVREALQQQQQQQSQQQQPAQDSESNSSQRQHAEQDEPSASASESSPQSAAAKDQPDEQVNQARAQRQISPEQESQQKEAQQQPESLALTQEQSQNEQAQALEQWLKRIPDDPAGLLRRKFQYQYQQRRQRDEGAANGW